MNVLYVSALLTVAIGVAHSYLGERYILIRLFKRQELPRIFGSAEFTIRTLRFAWHLTTIAWLGLAGIQILMVQRPVDLEAVKLTIGGTFLAHALVAGVASRGRHFAWPVFLAIGVIVAYASRI